MNAYNRVLGRIEGIADTIGLLCLLLIMFIVVFDVFMRYLFRAPLQWSYDFVSLYLTLGAVYFLLASSYRERAHIGVDLLIEILPARARLWSSFFGDLTGLLFFTPICFYGAQRTFVSFTQNEVLAGLIPWPTWLSNMILPVGTGIACLRLLYNAVRNGVAAFQTDVASGGRKAASQ